MFYLLDEKIIGKLKNAEEVDSLYTIPDGMNKENTQLLLRVLQAKEPEEIEDISTEQIIELMYFVQDMAPYIGRSSKFDNGSNTFKNKLLTSKPMKRRRVL